jgi:hypothetical protein
MSVHFLVAFLPQTHCRSTCVFIFCCRRAALFLWQPYRYGERENLNRSSHRIGRSNVTVFDPAFGMNSLRIWPSGSKTGRKEFAEVLLQGASKGRVKACALADCLPEATTTSYLKGVPP